MATTVTINNDRVLAALQARSLKGKAVKTLQVGYAAHYAVYVHENLDIIHRNGQAKYLEEPARRYAGQIGKVIKDKLTQKQGLEKALIAGGNYLLKKSLPLVPVDTGFLKGSAYMKWG